jgi:hypothetical protein
VKRDTAGVRRAAMHSVVFGSVLLIVANVILLKIVALWLPGNMQ